MREEVLPVPTM